MVSDLGNHWYIWFRSPRNHGKTIYVFVFWRSTKTPWMCINQQNYHQCSKFRHIQTWKKTDFPSMILKQQTHIGTQTKTKLLTHKTAHSHTHTHMHKQTRSETGKCQSEFDIPNRTAIYANNSKLYVLGSDSPKNKWPVIRLMYRPEIFCFHILLKMLLIVGPNELQVRLRSTQNYYSTNFAELFLTTLERAFWSDQTAVAFTPIRPNCVWSKLSLIRTFS